MKYASWDEFMTALATQAILRPIIDYVRVERIAGEVHPPLGSTFAFTETPLRDVKVVILGQDPYHGLRQAHGLAFSVPPGVAPPPSLRNIFKELCSDVGDGALRSRQGDYRTSGDLTPWTRQGVLLLNTALTVRQGETGSHLSQWQPFTDEVVRAVVASSDYTVHFVLWGSKARDAARRALNASIVETDMQGVSILRPPAFPMGYRTPFPTCTYSPHPSPLSADRGFFGSRPFSRANLALQLNNPGISPVDWRLP